jgi:hypothetical protein
MSERLTERAPETHLPDSVGPYRIKKEALDTQNGLLAVGGEATLLVAVLEDPRLPKSVKKHVEFVIKRARDGVSEAVQLQGRWQMLLAGAGNPHIEPVFDVMDRDEKSPSHYVMRRADCDLSTYIEQSLQHEEDFSKRSFISASIALQMAKGLAGVQAFATTHGYRMPDVVHRDLKPANVLLRITEEDVPFATLTDFNGISGREDELTNSLSIGAPEGSKAMATLHYMSPEQEQILYGRRAKENIDLRSDMFSLGLILIEMLGGQHGRRSVEIPEETNAALKGIIRRCIAENTAKRYETPEDLVIALEQFTNTMQGRAVTGPGQKLVSTNDLESLRDADATQLTPEQAAAQGALGRMKGNELLQLAASLGLTTAMGVLAAVLGGVGSVAGALGGKAVESISKEYERRKMVKAILDAMSEQFPQDKLLAKIIEAVKGNRDMTPARRDEILSGTILQQMDPEKMQEQIQAAVNAAFEGRETGPDTSAFAGIIRQTIAESLKGIEGLKAKKTIAFDIEPLIRQILQEIRDPHHRNRIALKTWLEGKRTRANTRTLANILPTYAEDEYAIKHFMVLTGQNQNLIPLKSDNAQDLWETIIGNFIEAGGVEKTVLEETVRAMPLVRKCNGGNQNLQEVMDAMANLYPDANQIRVLCERTGISGTRVSNDENPRNIWFTLLKDWNSGLDMDLEALIKRALKEINERFKRS